MLTHIDADGNDTPAIIVDDTTAANRAINIPEFVNLPPGISIDKIDPQATDFYRLFDEAYKLIENNQFPEAIDTLRKAIQNNPDDALVALRSGHGSQRQRPGEGRAHRIPQAVALTPTNPMFLDHLAVSLALNGDSAGAVEQLQRAIAVDPGSVEYRFNLAYVLESRGEFAERGSTPRKSRRTQPAGKTGVVSRSWLRCMTRQVTPPKRSKLPARRWIWR